MKPTKGDVDNSLVAIRLHDSNEQSPSNSMMRYYLSDTRYEVVRHACSLQSRWVCVQLRDDADIVWTDVCMGAEEFARLKHFQRYNHFIGMHAITRKNNLSRNLLRMHQYFGSDYNFFPMTWILPTEVGRLRTFAAEQGGIYIIKPDNSSQGKGIFLTRDLSSIETVLTPDQGYVAQRYIQNPYLIDGHKFDMRIYVLVSGCDPLRIYVHEEGLIRLCCSAYDSKGVRLDQVTRHLTNYAINAKDPSFVENSNPENVHDGHKRSLRLFFNLLAKQSGHDIPRLTEEIDSIIIKTLISIQPSLAHASFSYQAGDAANDSCFEILGFDVLLDAHLKPWLLEVNHAPSFATESDLDWLVKTKVIDDAFKLLHLTPKSRNSRKSSSMKDIVDRTGIAQQRDSREVHFGGYRKIYPTVEKEGQYWKFHEKAVELWNRFTGHAGGRKPIRLFSPPLEEKAAMLLPPVTDKTKNTKAKPRCYVVRPNIAASVPEQSKPIRPSSLPAYVRSRQVTASTSPTIHRGRFIRVLTNKGWEQVTILRTRSQEKLDIRFRDGEIMVNVLPKILNQSRM